QKGRIVDILAVTDDPAAGKTLLTLLGREVPPEIKGRALENLRLFLPTKWKDLRTKEMAPVVEALLRNPSSAAAGLQLVAAADDVWRVDDVARIAADAKAPADLRREA